MGFFDDLQVGREAELEAFHYVQEHPHLFSKFMQPLPPERTTLKTMKEFDFEISLKFEIKYDKKSSKTGNICFEKEGLESTKSHIMIYVTDEAFYIFDTEKLKLEYAKNPLKQLRGGDKFKQELYIHTKNSVEKFKSLVKKDLR